MHIIQLVPVLVGYNLASTFDQFKKKLETRDVCFDFTF